MKFYTKDRDDKKWNDWNIEYFSIQDAIENTRDFSTSVFLYQNKITPKDIKNILEDSEILDFKKVITIEEYNEKQIGVTYSSTIKHNPGGSCLFNQVDSWDDIQEFLNDTSRDDEYFQEHEIPKRIYRKMFKKFDELKERYKNAK